MVAPMNKKALTDYLANAKPEIAKHWASCVEAGLDGFTPETTGEVDRLIEVYFETLAELPDPAPHNDIMAAMSRLFAKLDDVNATVDESLLETDERELLVPIIIEGAKLAGLDMSKFPDGDPTGEIRNF